MRASSLGGPILLRSHRRRASQIASVSARLSASLASRRQQIQFHRGARVALGSEPRLTSLLFCSLVEPLRILVVVSSPPPPMLEIERQSFARELLTFEHEHNHKGDNKSQAAVFLHQNGKSDYVSQADRVAAEAPCFGLSSSSVLRANLVRLEHEKGFRELSELNSPGDGQKVLQF